MAESLGEAVLILRTDDTNLTKGIGAAKVEARELGTTFTRTAKTARDASSGVGEVAKSSQQASGALRQTSQAAQETVPAFTNHSQAVVRAGNAAGRAAMQQKLLVFQLNDIGVSLASGMNPLMVAIQQGSQISQIYGAKEGGVGRAFKETGNMITGLITKFPILTAAAAATSVVFGGLVAEINRGSKETVTFGDVALATWQVVADGLSDILKPVIDEISPWFIAAWDGVVSGAKIAGNLIINAFSAAFDDIKFVWSNFPDIIGAAITGAVNRMIAGVNKMVSVGVNAINGLIKQANSFASSIGADKALQAVGLSGSISQIAMPAGMAPYANPAAGRLGKALGARSARMKETFDRDPLGDLFDNIGDRARQNARKRKAKDAKPGDGSSPKAPKTASKDDSEERFQSDMNTLLLQTLAARRALATTIEERYRLERQSLDISSRQERESVGDNDKLNKVQKAKLIAQLDIKETLDRELLSRREAEERAQEALQVARATNANERDLADRSLRFAVTRNQRKHIELRLLNLAYAQEKADLDALIASKTATQAQKDIAAARLRILEELKAADQKGVEQNNESPLERYRREIGETGKRINDSLEEVSVNGLESLNSGLVEAIMGTKSLGAVFKDVAKQMIADILQIYIRQLLIKPLLDALSGGGGGLEGGGFGGGGGGGFGGIFKSIGSLFGGFFATGGMIPQGQFGIVGERGPEPVISTPRGAMVRPNSTLSSSQFRPSSPSINMPITIDATGADAAALARVTSRIDRMQAELPSTIARTVQDAGDRRMISSGGWR